MAQLQYRPAVPADAAACVDLRGRTRENAVSAERLVSVGITTESWGIDIQTGRQLGYICEDADSIAGFCFGERRTGAVVVLALLPSHAARNSPSCLAVASGFMGTSTRAAISPSNHRPTDHAHGNPQPGRPTRTGTGTGMGDWGARTGSQRCSCSINGAASARRGSRTT